MEECSMTATEAARLIDWLTAHGHTAEDATECIKYIATGTHKTNKIGSPKPSKAQEPKAKHEAAWPAMSPPL